MTDVVRVEEELAAITELWSPRVVARHNSTDVRLSKFHGEYIWHTHAETDELFMVIAGELVISLRDDVDEGGEETSVRLGPGDLYVVNRGRWHKPVAASPTSVLLLDAAGTLTTGDVNDGVPNGIPTLDGTEPRS